MSDIATLVSDHLDVWTAAIERMNGAGRGGGKRISLYGIERLRTLILDLAVLGRLVPQDEGDESATVLLKATTAARLAAVQEGKARKPEPTTELPNDLPELPRGWCWTQLAELAEISPSNASDDDVEASFVPMALVTSSIAGEHDFEVRKWGEIKKGFTHFADGDVALAKITPCFENGKAAILQGLRNGIGAGTTELHVARPWLPELNRRFLLLTMKTGTYLRNGEAKMTGTAGQQRITRSYFETTPLPLPPLAEQRRIVAKVDELMALCDALEGESAAALAAHQTLVETLLATLVNSADAADLAANWSRLEAHFDTLFTTEASVDALKQTVLELAVDGGLSPADRWPQAPVALKSGASLQNGYAFKSEWFAQAGIRLLRNINITHGSTDWGETVCLPEKDAEPFSRFLLAEGDIVLTLDRPFISTGTKVAQIVASDLPSLLLQRVARFQLSELLIPEYVLIWVNSPMFSKQIDPGRSNGVPHISTKQVEAAMIYIPPPDEQRRIIAIVDALMALCNDLKKRITDAGQSQMRLADSIVERAAA